MHLKRSDIVLVPFPFTDLTSSKIRPAIILSSNPQEEDVIIAFISSVTPESIGEFDFLLTSKNPHFIQTGLKKNSVIKMRKLLTISNTLILRRLGHVNTETQKELDKLLKKALGLSCKT